MEANWQCHQRTVNGFTIWCLNSLYKYWHYRTCRSFVSFLADTMNLQYSYSTAKRTRDFFEMIVRYINVLLLLYVTCCMCHLLSCCSSWCDAPAISGWAPSVLWQYVLYLFQLKVSWLSQWIYCTPCCWWILVRLEQKTLQFTKLCKGDAIWVNTRKRQKWFWSDIIMCWIPGWPLQD